jgi:hypothetical protein
MRIITEINGIETNEPNNLAELSINIAFSANGYDKVVSLPRYQFGVGGGAVNDASVILNKWLNDGNGGGVGMFEGVPFKQYLERMF